MTYSTAERKSLANQAERGNLRSLGKLLRDTVDRTAGLIASELAVLDGVTAGTGAASKAAVLDASGNFIMPATGMFGLSRAALAAAGSTSADAGVIATQVVAVTASDGTKGVALPAAATTEGPILVINTVLTSGANLKVYPVDGGNDQINGGAEDAAFTMGPGKAAWFIPTSATQWYAEDSSGVTATTSELNILDGVTATATELNRAADVSGRLVAAGGTLAVTEALHDGKTILLDTAAGSVCTLPAATGSGARFRFVVSVDATSNSHIIKVAASTDDLFLGSLLQTDTDTTDTLISMPALAGDTFDTITFSNDGTQGGLPGDIIEVEDIAAGTWAIFGHVNGSGSVATPFSSAISA